MQYSSKLLGPPNSSGEVFSEEKWWTRTGIFSLGGAPELASVVFGFSSKLAMHVPDFLFFLDSPFSFPPSVARLATVLCWCSV
jgi:hypothetical protein